MINMKIQKFTTKIIKIEDLSENAREVTFSLPKEIDEFSFLPGQFMNFFVDVGGKKERRAYSLCSSVDSVKSISFCIRKGGIGGVSEAFWNKDVKEKTFDLMGPIGLNTVDKLEHNKIFLLAMGVGISPVKSIADYLVKNTDKKVKLYFGNKNEEQILYKKYFNELALEYENFSVEYVLSDPEDKSYEKIGFVQDFITKENFENSSVYMCGIPAMAKSCREVIENTGAKKVQIMEESFD